MFRALFLLQGIFLLVWIYYTVQGLALPSVIVWFLFPLYALNIVFVALVATILIWLAFD